MAKKKNTTVQSPLKLFSDNVTKLNKKIETFKNKQIEEFNNLMPALFKEFPTIETIAIQGTPTFTNSFFVE